jgi:hypothetical protein
MDVEAELIRSSQWSELKRYYTSRHGHAWELGWIHLIRLRDRASAIEHFSKAFSDPKYEEASHILLWWLGKRTATKAVDSPPTLRLYDAFKSARTSVLLEYAQSAQSNVAYVPFLFRGLVEKLSLQELAQLEKFPRTASFSLLIAEAYNRKWKDFDKAKIFYDEFFADPWTKHVIGENRRQLFDSESSRRLRMAYAQKDAAGLRKILSTIRAGHASADSPWSKALLVALDWDLTNVAQNAVGFAFWKETELSPKALQIMREVLFSKEHDPIPPAIHFWTQFFDSPELLDIPPALDPDALSLWQIRVEAKSEVLSEALLRFPQEERFLFLWSLRQRDKAKNDPRRWPADEKESSVVRKSLEKAFERSTNKVLWFDRLRATGCSQDFYEYAIQRAPIPIRWVIEDLENAFISNSSVIRAYLRDQLAIAAPNDSESHRLNPSEFLKSVSFLTPAEKQHVLLSRFVLTDIPPAILNDESMDLFFEARSRVSPEMFEKWQKIVLKFLGEKARRSMSAKDWRWVELAWETDAVALDRFSPRLDSATAFPWETYLEKLASHQKIDLILNALSRVPDERLKESWIRNLSDYFEDDRLVQAINSLKTDHVRHGLMSELLEKRNDLQGAIEQCELELAASPILNEQAQIARRQLDLLKKLSLDGLEKNAVRLEEAYRVLDSTGSLDEEAFRSMADLYNRLAQYEKSFSVTVTQWARCQPALREDLLPKLLERAFQARSIEAAQRLLVDFVFENGMSNALTYEILGILLDHDSVFRLQHLRREFIERSSQLFPLHAEVLKAKSAYDYRALLLWESFYGEPLDTRAQLPAYDHKRRYELWQFTESISHVESASVFAKYLNTTPKKMEKALEIKGHEFLEKAKRATQRLSKSYGIRKPPDIVLTNAIAHPFVISFRPWQIEVKLDFFNELDEEMWASIIVGTFQVFDDYQKGLYDEKHLMERFFQGMLLAGTPIAKLIRLWVWLAMSEGIIEPTLLRSEPEELIEKLPFINSLLIFYLSQDFSQKMDENALPLA